MAHSSQHDQPPPQQEQRQQAPLPPPRASASAASRANADSRELLPRHKLQELLAEVAPGERLDESVVELLQDHVDDFVENVVEFSCKMAKHRQSSVLEARDVRLYLKKAWDIDVPGYGAGDDGDEDVAPAAAAGSAAAAANGGARGKESAAAPASNAAAAAAAAATAHARRANEAARQRRDYAASK